MILAHQVRRGAYADSIVLMQLQASLAALPGVEDAGVAMATAANLDLLRANELLPAALEAELDVGGDDLLLVVRAATADGAEAALGEVDRLLERRGTVDDDEEFRPRSLRGALRLAPEAGWVLVSVPGRWAARVAREALAADRHVFLYSDNVSVAEEVALKRLAAERGRLVMGPDCGTASIAGVGLGFANRVRRGPIGLVAAAGTGLQMVASRIHQLGSGVSHAIGTGGRDLSAEVEGITAVQGLSVLAADAETRVVVVVSKPPAATVTPRVLSRAWTIGKPVVVCFLGLAAPEERAGPLHFARSLDHAAELAVELAATGDEDTGAGPAAPAANSAFGRGDLRALFSGGTLALETLLGLTLFVAPLHSNLSLPGVEPVEDPATSRGHTVLDLGADEFTVGRLHPMIDPELRRRRLQRETADPETGTILLDLVLGEGAHPDPAAALAPAIADAAAREDLEVGVLVVGTDEDPQDLARQIEILEKAGARVLTGVGEAVGWAARRVGGSEPPPTAAIGPEAFAAPLTAINLGLESFHNSLVGQGATSVHVEWRPPAGGDERLVELLDRLEAPREG